MIRKRVDDRIRLSFEVRLGIFFALIILLIGLLSPKDATVLPKDEVEVPQSSDEIVRGDKSRMNIIFTFDGGSKDISSLKILNILKNYSIKTTFFLTGDFVRSNPDIVKKMKEAGHEIYNHTENHPYLTQVSDRDILLELEGMDKSLKDTIGRSSKPYFRPPYGDRDDRVLRIAYGAGYRSVYWTVDALDWQESLGRSPEEVRNIVIGSLAPGNIYLFHLGDNISGDILESLINEITTRGYKIVSLKQGL